MNQPRSSGPATAYSGALPPVGELDADLKRTVRRTAYMRQGFYVVVLLVALAGQVSGAVETLHIPLAAAIPAVAALELGGIVVLANADVRRRLGERAVASRVLSVAIAAGAVAFNWLAHADHLLGGFFAGMSALGYLVWLMHTENQRRDRLRATGDLAWTTPAYEVVGHWLAHPFLTRRARALAKADPHLGLYDSIAAARAAIRRERRQKAISQVLHRKIRAAVDPTTADIAVHVYDLEEIATRLADSADYAGLTALIAADLAPARLAAGPAVKRRGQRGVPATPALPTGEPSRPALTVGPPDPLQANGYGAAGTEPVNGGHANGTGTNGTGANGIGANGIGTNGIGANGNGAHANGHGAHAATGPLADLPGPLTVPGTEDAEGVLVVDPVRPGRARRAVTARGEAPQVLTDALRQVGDLLPPPRRGDRASRINSTTAEFPVVTTDAEPAPNPLPAPTRAASLRTLVHATLDERVPPGDPRDNTMLMALVTDVLQLSEVEQLSAANYVHTWRQDFDSGRRVAAG